jgi:hypothetical protein
MANNQIVISRIQNRRGIRENLPQPLLPGEFALTVDTGELWIGTDPNQPPFGVRTYGSGAGDISAAENIADNQVVSAKFVSGTLDEVAFGQLRDTLVGNVTFTLVDEDILWDGRDAVFIAADTSVNANNTVLGIYQAVENAGFGTLLYTYADALAGTYFVSLGALNDPTVDPVPPSYAFDPVDGDFLFTIAGSNAEQGANAATLINKIHGAQLVTTLANLQVTTTGIGVGSPTFRDWVMYNNEANLPVAPTWISADTPQTVSADSVTDTMRVVAGEGISIDADISEDYFRITNTYADIPTNEFTLTANTTSFTNVTNLNFDIDAVSDVIFLDYSLNIGAGVDVAGNYTAGGQMLVVGNKNVGTGETTLTDNQVEVRDSVGDPFAANTVICANFDGTDGATSFTESARSEPAVFIGNAQLDTAQFNFGTASLLLDGTQDGITFGTDAADWAAYGVDNATDFTVEAFVRFNALPTPGNQMAIAMYSFTDSTIWELEVNNNGGTYELRGRRGGAIILAGTITPVVNTWYHAALQLRDTAATDTIDLLWAGNRVATSTTNGIANVGFTDEFPITVGSYDNTSAGTAGAQTKVMDGWIDDFRYTVGVARYGSGATYTVPTSPLCAPPAPLAGDVNFQATYVAGTPNRIQIQYTNTFANDVTMRVVRKRWMSY